MRAYLSAKTVFSNAQASTTDHAQQDGGHRLGVLGAAELHQGHRHRHQAGDTCEHHLGVRGAGAALLLSEPLGLIRVLRPARSVREHIALGTYPLPTAINPLLSGEPANPGTGVVAALSPV